MTTTVLATINLTAGLGSQSTPVKTALQTDTTRFSVQVKITTTRGITPGLEEQNRKCFTLCWATSPDDLTLANVPTLLSGCTSSMAIPLDKIQELAGQFRQIEPTIPKGVNLYTWIQAPASVDAYAVILTVTELYR